MSFDRLARHYRWMELVLAGRKLQRCRTEFLNRVTGAQNILIAGEGNGRFLLECRRRLPVARITVVDSSAGMLEIAHNRLMSAGANMGGIEFIHSDILTWTPREKFYDLIVTHFFLDCFPADQLEQAVTILARSATHAAAWLLADFQVPACGLRRWRAKGIHWLMYAFFHQVTRLSARTLVSPDDFLVIQGFVLQEKQMREWELLHTDLWLR